VDGEPGRTKWVLKVDVLRGIGAQYFIGDFDGTQFINDAAADVIRRVDFGEDFYAAQSWSDEPNRRRIWIAWMNNWHYANQIPTSPWRGVFSIPRQLSLRRFPGGLRLVQQPIAELGQFTTSIYDVENMDINAQLAALEMDMAQEIKVQVTLGTAKGFGLKLCTGDGEETVIGYETERQELFIDRRLSGTSIFSDQFADVHRAPLVPQGGKISLHIFLDSCSVEVFADDGATAMSDLIFPQSGHVRLEFYARDGNVQLNSLEIRKLT
jgi:fructan beta-fructosidase